MVLRRAVIVAAACGLAAPAAADAAVRHAAPGGSGSACSEAAPCDLTTAIEAAASGDEVVIGAGDYAPGAGISGGEIDVHGAAGQARPRIRFNRAFGLSLYDGSRLSDVEVTTTDMAGGAAIYFSGEQIERVVARHAGLGAAIRVADGSVPLIRDTLAVNSGSGAAIRVTGPGSNGEVQARLEQVTAIATGAAGTALAVDSSAGRSAIVSVDRSILRNTAGGDDVGLAQLGAALQVTTTRSAFARVSRAGSPLLTSVGTISAAPLLGGPEFQQLAGSPTIDAGGSETSGAFDLDGDPRWLGSATDVGADEFRPQPVTPAATARQLGPTAVAVDATLDTGGLAGSWRVDYGPTAAYGASTGELPLVAARGSRALTAALAGLAADGDVHYRVTLTTAGGTSQSADGVVRTAAPVTLPPVVRELTRTVTRTVVAAPKVSAVSVTRRAVTFTLDGRARVTVTVKRGRRAVRTIVRTLAAGRRTVRLPRLGSGRFSVSVQADATGKPVVKPLRIR
ncbi:choice-of-anchor Q domain-containing protein [Conexibacter sp. JD483]|uniref:choice-of-anchor Q domain-containing protein n=1 Tax=unclassified Conexibacter TaxID=2627773 RepID=UPI0027242626|nr:MULTISPECIES: choice-of-anchor Q domain-containing protein [unclassified Conexibacter]MDO8187235.1 choice-of-anchor Q domain-containing protein [Conexibacter sp. CPCC 205706]MDO8199332.1 choice-of-anchor Q domain-containing protein [Conexibacter sp. CPCC 205762]MDR9369267.1 choice-of-anchor Q domain-containing protein [Conexibacter sp. JD483]